MTPHEFLASVVQPNMAAFLDARDSLRLAFNAIASIDALAAVIYYAKREAVDGGDTLFRENLAVENPEFRILRDAAKAQKHGILHRSADKNVIQRASDVSSRAPVFGELPWGEFRFDHGPQVILDTKNGPRNAATVALACLNLLKREMAISD